MIDIRIRKTMINMRITMINIRIRITIRITILIRITLRMVNLELMHKIKDLEIHKVQEFTATTELGLLAGSSQDTLDSNKTLAKMIT